MHYIFTERQNLGLDQFGHIADDKLNVAKRIISVFDGVENIVGKGENAGYQHFLLFPQCFQKALYRVVKSGDCVVKGYINQLTHDHGYIAFILSYHQLNLKIDWSI